MEKYYLCIDLKSFYASVECVERGLDPLTTNLVVADPSRGNGAICLAITPSMKKLGIKNRCRIFEIPKHIKYITALPRMKKYMEVSAQIYSVYLKYISQDDIHVYSIDECFLDVTKYIKLYNKSPKEIARMLLDAVYQETGLTATVGIGTNLFLAKVALDITAKKSPDFMGFLDENIFKEHIWHHQPITDIWNIGRGIAKRLLRYGIIDLYGVTRIDPKVLYKEFGINAELLIDHAWGVEPCTIEDIHKYHSKSQSVSNSQILFEDYGYDDAFIVLKEMVDINVLELIDKKLVTNNISLYIGYSKDVIKPTGGSLTLDGFTQSREKLMKYFCDLFIRTTNKEYKIRRIGLGFNNVKDEIFQDFDLFTDFEKEEKEKSVQNAIINIKKKYGKNSIIKGMDLQEKATTIKRNKLVGGHNGGEDE
ncbi:MAG: DNA repair protein [Bacilli bacterium]|nr:DNA repair protein [Bacilli bacterium]